MSIKPASSPAKPPGAAGNFLLTPSSPHLTPVDARLSALQVCTRTPHSASPFISQEKITKAQMDTIIDDWKKLSAAFQKKITPPNSPVIPASPKAPAPPKGPLSKAAPKGPFQRLRLCDINKSRVKPKASVDTNTPQRTIVNYTACDYALINPVFRGVVTPADMVSKAEEIYRNFFENNGVLQDYNPDASPQEKMAKFQGAIDAYRIMINTSLSKAPTIQAENLSRTKEKKPLIPTDVTYRGIGTNDTTRPGMASFRNKLTTPGAIVEEGAILSTSPTKPWNCDTMIVVRLHNNHPGRMLSSANGFGKFDEGELAFPAGSAMQVVESCSKADNPTRFNQLAAKLPPQANPDGSPLQYKAELIVVTRLLKPSELHQLQREMQGTATAAAAVAAAVVSPPAAPSSAGAKTPAPKILAPPTLRPASFGARPISSSASSPSAPTFAAHPPRSPLCAE
jgi:hypothetical protein